MTAIGKDTLSTRRTLKVGEKEYDYFSIKAAEEKIGDVSRLPFSMKVLLENLLRFEDGGTTVSVDDIKAVHAWQKNRTSEQEIQYRPGRVLMQDFTGVPAIVDLAAMRDAMVSLGGDPQKINPVVPVHLVIDHSVMVDSYGSKESFRRNVEKEYERNIERYEFLRWGAHAFDNLSVVPPDTGICHQVNLEYLGRSVWTSDAADGKTIAYPDTLVGTDSHTTMIDSLGILGWGVGGIEAEAAMLGQPISMLLPEVVGFKMVGQLPEGITATDLVLTVTQMLRKHGVVGRFVEFFGPGLVTLPIASRATIGNMSPEYGATCGFFPIDRQTLAYLRFTGRSEEQLALIEAYTREQGLWRDENTPDPIFTNVIELDLSTVKPSVAGPKRPQDRVLLEDADQAFESELVGSFGKAEDPNYRVPVKGNIGSLGHGDVVIAAITSCTNTSNPEVLVAAGLLARKARALGLQPKPWVKTSFAPGSQVVTDYFNKSHLTEDMDAMGFNLVGYGCTTCIGNSGPLNPEISEAVTKNDLVAVSVLSGNRNFEGRISPDTKANYLMSPPLVVAYSLLGNFRKNLVKDPLGHDQSGKAVYLKDIWPTNAEVTALIESTLTPDMFSKRYADVYKGDAHWQAINVTGTDTYQWNPDSTYIRNPPFFEGMTMKPAPVGDVKDASCIALLGDSVTTDHISPAGAIKPDGPAGEYLHAHNISRARFNSFGSRRGNHEVMMRGTFANIRIRNLLAPGTEGGYTTYLPTGEVMSIYDASMLYQKAGTPLVVLAGKEYGTGSSRDWAAKGTLLLGIKAVIAESFERIHRSNLIDMGVLALQFKEGETASSLGLTGKEKFDIPNISDLKPRQALEVRFTRPDGTSGTFETICRIDTENEIDYFYAGGILQYVLRKLAA